MTDNSLKQLDNENWLLPDPVIRVAEAAMKFKCSIFNAPKDVDTFNQELCRLKEGSILSDKDEHSWQKIRKYRNSSTHPKDQEMFSQGWTIDFLKFIPQGLMSFFNE